MIETRRKLHYLVGGFRISLDEDSNTPGPRAHILGFVGAAKRAGYELTLFMASSFPGMGRFKKIRQSDYSGAGSRRVIIADFVRISAALWSGAQLYARTLLSPSPTVIYERTAVLQSLTTFHARKRRAIRVVEANGILSRETARDRKVLHFERFAAVIERHVLRQADLVVAVSGNLSQELQAFAGIPESKILVLPNGVDHRFLDQPKLGSPNRIVVGFVGSVVPWQHLDHFLRAVAHASDHFASAGIKVTCEIVGDGPELRGLQQQAKRENHPVHFWGRKSPREVVKIMASWSVGFAGHQKSSSSTMYHSPLKLYEYSAMGLVSVCTPSADATSLALSGVPVFQFESDAEQYEAIRAAIAFAAQRDLTDEKAQRQAMRDHHSWDERIAEFQSKLGI